MRIVRSFFFPLFIGVAFHLSSATANEVGGQLRVPNVSALFFKELPPVLELSVEAKAIPTEMVVSSSDVEAAKMVAVGYAYLNAGWDVQAYRHFCGALKRDENCLLAHVGLTLSLSSPYHHELLLQRKAAMLRLVELIGLKLTGEYYFPEKERGFAIAVSHLFVSGRKGGSQAFSQLAKRYPKDKQIQLMDAMFKRDGYNVLGKVNPGEYDAIKIVEKIYKNNPESVLAQQYMLMMYAEAPIDPEMIRVKLLPIARNLAGRANVATWKHWLGVYEYRCGNLNEAERAFKESVILLENWKRKEEVADADADALWKSYLYLASVQFDLGKNKEAENIAKMFAGLKLDKSRLWASGSQLILWDGYSLGIRLRLPRSGSVDTAIATMPNKDKIIGLVGKSAAPNYYEFHTYYLAMRKAYEEKDKQAMKALVKDFERVNENLAKVKSIALTTGEAHSCLRHFELLEMLYVELSGIMTADKIEKSLQFSSAVEREKGAVQMLPPLCMHTMESQLVRVLQKRGEHQRAFTVAKSGLKRRPVSMTLWKQFRKSAIALKMKSAEKLANKKIQSLRPSNP